MPLAAAPRFRRFAMEPLRVSTLPGFNRLSLGAAGER
jgi:hypothetical protein